MKFCTFLPQMRRARPRERPALVCDAFATLAKNWQVSTCLVFSRKWCDQESKTNTLIPLMLADISKDALDNTPITPAALNEGGGAMVFVPQVGRIASPTRLRTGELREDGDGHMEGEQVDGVDRYQRLNSPRTGSGPYTPVPNITVRELKTTEYVVHLF